MKSYVVLILLLSIVSCRKDDLQPKSIDHGSSEADTIHREGGDKRQIRLGEDIKEIQAYTKDIYEIKNTIYVDIDLVQVRFRNIDEKFIVNERSTIRTYIADQKTLIYANDCDEIDAHEMLRRKKTLLSDSSIVAVGQSKDGRLVSINFGCYE